MQEIEDERVAGSEFELAKAAKFLSQRTSMSAEAFSDRRIECTVANESLAVGGRDTLPSTQWSSAEQAARAGLVSTPWWLWWNVLSLDAPMVAVAWALVFAKSAQVRLPNAEVAALGLLVWLIYTVDRLLDGCFPALAASNQAAVLPGEGAFGSPLRQRHAFHREHARAITWIASGVAVLTSFLIFIQTNAES